MTARKSLHFFVLVLCLWLPLQAIAGQWLHCAQIQTSLADKEQVPATKHNTAPCHQIAQENLQAIDKNPTPTDDVKSCKHCQFMCHWNCVLLMDNLIPHSIQLTPHYTPFILPSPAQPLLALPQKPPQIRTLFKAA